MTLLRQSRPQREVQMWPANPKPLLLQPLWTSEKVLVTQLCPTLCNPMDCSPPGSSVHGILLQEYWSGLPCPSPGNLPDPKVKPRSPTLQADSSLYEPPASYCGLAGPHRCSPVPLAFQITELPPLSLTQGPTEVAGGSRGHGREASVDNLHLYPPCPKDQQLLQCFL